MGRRSRKPRRPYEKEQLDTELEFPIHSTRDENVGRSGWYSQCIEGSSEPVTTRDQNAKIAEGSSWTGDYLLSLALEAEMFFLNRRPLAFPRTGGRNYRDSSKYDEQTNNRQWLYVNIDDTLRTAGSFFTPSSAPIRKQQLQRLFCGQSLHFVEDRSFAQFA